MFKEWWCCCYNPLTRLSCNCVKSSHLCKVLVFGNFSRVSFKFSPKLCQYYHVIKKLCHLEAKMCQQNFSFGRLCAFLSGTFRSKSIQLQVKSSQDIFRKIPQSPLKLNIMLLTSEKKTCVENKFVLNLWNCKVWDWNFMSIKPGRNYGWQSSRY